MAELVREVFIEATPDVIFQFLVDPAKYVEWGGSEAELDPRPGGTYRALMGGTHWGEGEFLEVDPDRRVVFSFGWAEPGHPIPAGSTTVEIALEPVGDGHHGAPHPPRAARGRGG